MGLIRPKPTKNPASNIAARVSLPLTMSNILQTLGFHPAYPPHPFWPVWPAPFARGRGIRPSPLSRQHQFLIFFQQPKGGRKTLKNRRQRLLSGPLWGPAIDQNCGRREGGIYARLFRTASAFWLRMWKLRVFHRTTSLNRREGPKSRI